MKICNQCKIEKEETEFNKNKRRKDGLQTMCKTCSQENSKEYYNNNTEEHKKNIIEQNKKRKKILQNRILKEFEKGCKDCGNKDPRVLEFDHLPEFKKKMDVSIIVSSSHSLKMLEEEIAKCDIVCANCHRIRTYSRTPSYRNTV